jgi:hypothetical protein
MRTLKTWKPWDFAGVDCTHCGNHAEVLTACAKGFVCEDDEARCCACGLPGRVSVDEDQALISWHDEPECSCEWCIAHPEEDCACGHCTPNRSVDND